MGFFHSSGECHEQAYLQASFDHVRAVCTSGAGRRATNVESVQGLGSIGKRPVIPTPPPVPNPAAPARLRPTLHLTNCWHSGRPQIAAGPGSPRLPIESQRRKRRRAQGRECWPRAVVGNPLCLTGFSAFYSLAPPNASKAQRRGGYLHQRALSTARTC